MRLGSPYIGDCGCMLHPVDKTPVHPWCWRRTIEWIRKRAYPGLNIHTVFNFRAVQTALYRQDVKWYKRWGTVIPIPVANMMLEYEFAKEFKGYRINIEREPLPEYLGYCGSYYIEIDVDDFKQYLDERIIYPYD